MISQADLQVIQTVFGKTAEELSGAISSDQEVSLDLRLNGRVISQEDEQALKTTLTDAGVEIGMKKVAKAAGLDLAAGEKDAKIIADKMKTTISTTLEDKYKNMTPSDELVELKTRAKDWEDKYNKLTETYDTTKGELTEWEHKYSGLEQEIKTKGVNDTILKAFPEKMKMDKNDALLIARNNFEFEQTDKGIVTKKNGAIITDPVGDPEKLENVIKSFTEEKQWIKGKGMNGTDRAGGGTGLPKGLSDEQAMKYITEAGIDSMSDKGLDMFNKLTTAE